MGTNRNKLTCHQASRRALQQSKFFRRGDSGHTVPQHCRPHTPHRSALQFMRARSSTPPPRLNAFVSPRLEHRHAVPAAQYRAVQHELCNSGPNAHRQLRRQQRCISKQQSRSSVLFGSADHTCRRTSAAQRVQEQRRRPHLPSVEQKLHTCRRRQCCATRQQATPLSCASASLDPQRALPAADQSSTD